jgi:hypothetical protein
MFSTGVLNIVIGLVFIYLLYSLLASIVQEFISAWISLRARYLRKGISRMLDDNTKENELSQAFYKHPLIKFLGESKRNSIPSYIDAKNFSKVFIDLLRGEQSELGKDFKPIIQQSLDSGLIKWGTAKICPQSLSYIKSLWVDSQGDIERFKALLEQWFDDTMERTRGWYKKRIQLILFCIGLTIAVIFNVDSISISKKLTHNPDLAEKLANNAAIYLQNHKTLESLPNATVVDTTTSAADSSDQLLKIVKKSNNMLDSANSLINSNISDASQLLGLGWTAQSGKDKGKFCVKCNFHWWSIIGWIITALAISLGAPFWFDILNKVMKARNSGTTESTDNSQSKQEPANPPVNRVG